MIFLGIKQTLEIILSEKSSGKHSVLARTLHAEKEVNVEAMAIGTMAPFAPISLAAAPASISSISAPLRWGNTLLATGETSLPRRDLATWLISPHSPARDKARPMKWRGGGRPSQKRRSPQSQSVAEPQVALPSLPQQYQPNHPPADPPIDVNTREGFVRRNEPPRRHGHPLLRGPQRRKDLLTSEQRSEVAKKAVLKRQQRFTPEQLSEHSRHAVRARLAKTTPEQRSESAKKAA